MAPLIGRNRPSSRRIDLERVIEANIPDISEKLARRIHAVPQQKSGELARRAVLHTRTLDARVRRKNPALNREVLHVQARRGRRNDRACGPVKIERLPNFPGYKSYGAS